MDIPVIVLPDGRVFVDYGPSSVVITAKCGDKWLTELARDVFPVLLGALEEISEALLELRRPPDRAIAESLTGLPRVMADSVLAVDEPTLTPMAAVAGTVADCLADWLSANGADFVVVNNGGDVAIRLGSGRSVRMGILPDISNGNMSQIVTIRAGDGIGGVCTSGLGGRSLTRGVAGAVTVFSECCAIADACATHIANCTYIRSPRVRTVLAKEIEPESDIAELTVVTSVSCLTQEEKVKALDQARRETLRQIGAGQRGNLMYMAADIQGSRIWVPEPMTERWEKSA